jgi:hypothetical protein
MKRYLLFAGHAYYPAGGWDDFVADYEYADVAAAEGSRRQGLRIHVDQCDWWHVIDRDTGQQVACAYL